MSTTSYLQRFLDPFAGCLSREVAGKVVGLRADEAGQERIEYLAERSNEGKLTSRERGEYSAYLIVIDLIAILQAKARSVLRKDS